MQYLKLSMELGLPRVATIQNEYNFLRRYYDLDLAELAYHEDVGLLAYSPLAAGAISGKYLGGVLPPGTRGAVSGSAYRNNQYTEPAIRAYIELAKEHGLDVNQMAIAFCLDQAVHDLGDHRRDDDRAAEGQYRRGGRDAVGRGAGGDPADLYAVCADAVERRREALHPPSCARQRAAKLHHPPHQGEGDDGTKHRAPSRFPSPLTGGDPRSGWVGVATRTGAFGRPLH